MENNYYIAYKQCWSELKKRNLKYVSKIRDVKYREDINIFEIEILKENYVLDCDKETIYNRDTLESIDIYLGIILLNYLGFSDENINIEDEWISLKELPKGGYLYYPAFYKSSISVLIDEFGDRSEMFSIIGSSLGGSKYKLGDTSLVFNIFPKIPVCVVIWEGDNEISANATVLFDNSIQKIMHIEVIIGVGTYIVNKLKDLTIYLK